jgi:solute carrier family 25 (mitochondrial 2-oxodicarboxylate transporter), member 21
MQNQLFAEGVTPKYSWTVPGLMTVYQEEGFAALYKGIGPRLVRLGKHSL